MSVINGPIVGAVALVVLLSNGASAMTGECYFDRRPGGCFERETQRDKDAAAQKTRNEDFVALMTSTPASSMPDYCGAIPDPRNEYATMATRRPLSETEKRICTAAAMKWQASEHQKAVQQVSAYNKASRWQKIEASNGTIYKLDVAHITHFDNGNVDIVVYKDEGAYNPENLSRFVFDCHGHFRDEAHFGEVMYAPPKSIAGQIQHIACGK